MKPVLMNKKMGSIMDKPSMEGSVPSVEDMMPENDEAEPDKLQGIVDSLSPEECKELYYMLQTKYSTEEDESVIPDEESPSEDYKEIA